jgi:hypothetical protein
MRDACVGDNYAEPLELRDDNAICVLERRLGSDVDLDRDAAAGALGGDFRIGGVEPRGVEVDQRDGGALAAKRPAIARPDPGPLTGPRARAAARGGRAKGPVR